MHMKSRLYRGMTRLCLTALLGGPVFAAAPDVEYTARIRGLDDSAIEKLIEDSTLTFKLAKRPPATLGQLSRRIDGDLPRIETLLQAYGYYDASVSVEMDRERDPVRVSFWVEEGKLYVFHRIELRFSGPEDRALKKIKPLRLKGHPAVAAHVFEEEQRILALIQRQGYPFPMLGKRTVTLDREKHRVDVQMEFDPGIHAVYGPLEVEGLETVKEKYIQRQLPWAAGDPYDAKQLDDFENNLLRAGLFGMVRVVPRPPEDNSPVIPVKVTVTERDKRTIRFGVSYSDIGPGAKVLWEHRNVFGNGEHLEASFTGSDIERGGKITLRRPGFRRANQALVLDLDVLEETPDAYTSRKTRASAIVLRDFTPEIQAGLGAGYQYSRVKQLGSDEIHNLLFFPLQAVLDNRDDSLNPMSGHHLFGRTAYFQDTLGSDSFLKSVIEGRHYYTFSEEYRFSSALRLALGSIDGTSVGSVPADERFYAGGGGSIRGYEYQAVGPSLGGTPLGGSKLMEFSAELRVQPGRKLGYVLFLDGGTVFDDEIGEADRSLRYGAGLGLRFFTGIGPLRADLAYPLNPDSTQSQRIQFYISLGQAF